MKIGNIPMYLSAMPQRPIGTILVHSCFKNLMLTHLSLFNARFINKIVHCPKKKINEPKAA